MKQQLKQIYRALSEGKLSSKDALEEIKALKLQSSEKKMDVLLAAPVWQTNVSASESSQHEYAERHIVLCEQPQVDVKELQDMVPGSHCLGLQEDPSRNIAERYSDYALACFEKLKTILANKPLGKVLVQVVVNNEQERTLFAGLSGLLKTAMLENPQLIGQLILTTSRTTQELAEQLQAEKVGLQDTLIKYEQGARKVLRWQTVSAQSSENHAEPNIAFKDRGVYLITGGLGGLGVLFAKEILRQTTKARIILTGRSAPSVTTQAVLDKLSAQVGQLEYRQLDIGNLDDVRQLIVAIEREYQQLNGIIHSAGMTADNFIMKKTAMEFSQVLAPKVAGTYHLDEASKDIGLDFFVLFSSIASAMGNLGQADYAAANGFMDQFAAYRNRLVASQRRKGHTLSINWTLWSEGGMGMDVMRQKLLREATGIEPIQTTTGIESFHHSLALQRDQILVMQGDFEQLNRVLANQTIQPEFAPGLATVERPSSMVDHGLLEKTEDYLCKQFSVLLKMPSHKIDSQAGLEKYGIDSILAVNLINQLEKTFGPLSKTLLFEYQNIHSLAEYFIKSHAAQLATLFAAEDAGGRDNQAIQSQYLAKSQSSPTQHKQNANRRFAAKRVTSPPAIDSDPIAIIGVSGRYPEAVDIDAYWQNLREGKDCIIEVPKERWDWQKYFSEDRTQTGHHYSRWGGFITGVDEFDPLFFNISPKEAKYIDPQERLFLQHAWMAIEDAGYTRASLQIPHAQNLPGQVGVYVGAMYSEYQLFGAEASLQGNRMAVSGSFASIANRVSYALNLHGPSMTLDTMCSSSLTAIHLACQDLKQGRTGLAIAGGVNVSIHPNKYLLLSAGQFISSEGHCQSFGEGGDGYIPGEGVGAVILKRLSEAERDGNRIYGVIRGSGLNHGGKTNGYTVPNPQAQADVIRQALAEANIDPRHVSYIEAHGTGTKLGDPIEIAALSNAFYNDTKASSGEVGFCAIGSAKSNIGHCESAAGIAGVTKVLLQMKHEFIAPSLHSEKLNPHIDFNNTPFVVNQSLRKWEQPEVDGRRVPRIAGISSFGAGGSNAHVIIEEYQAPVVVPAHSQINSSFLIIPISARTAEQLQQKARNLLAFIKRHERAIDLLSMAFTLQVGREAMDERVGFLVNSIARLTEKLERFVAGDTAIDEVYQGQVKRHKSPLSLFGGDADFQKTIDQWIADKKYSKLLELWVNGLDLDWQKFFEGNEKPQLMSLPSYPFARERYWMEPPARIAATNEMSVLHPLVHTNTSNLLQQSYTSTYRGTESFLTHDAVTGQKVLPQRVALEMMRAAVALASPNQPEAGDWELQNTVWGPPMIVTGDQSLHVALVATEDDSVDVEIYSAGEADDSMDEIIHCQSHAVFNRQSKVRETSFAPVLATRLPPATDGLAKTDAAPKLTEITLAAANELEIAVSNGTTLSESINKLPPFQGEGWGGDGVKSATSQANPIPLPIPASAGTESKSPLKGEERKAVPLIAVSAAREIVPQALQHPPRVTVALRDLSSEESLQVTPNASSTVPMLDLGHGVFSIEIGAASTIESLLEALNRARQEASIKVFLIKGEERGFWQHGRTACNQAIERQLFSAVASFPYPVIAVMRGNAQGAGFLLGAVCDLMVCSEAGSYGYTDFQQGLFPSVSEAHFFRERLGEVLADDFLYQYVTLTGEQLKKKGWTCWIASPAQIEAKAMELATDLAQKSHTALRLLKAHLGRHLLPLVNALKIVDVVALETPNTRSTAKIISPIKYIKLEVQAGNIVVVKIAATRHALSVKELVNNLRNVFDQINRSSNYKSVVLTSDHASFLPPTVITAEAEVVMELKGLVQDCKLPVIAVLASNAEGVAWLLGLWCDACIYQTQGRYCTKGSWTTPSLAREVAAVFVQRLGSSLGQEVCLTAQSYSGLDLQARLGALTVVDSTDVMPQALRLAAFWCQWPQETVVAWKKARIDHAQNVLNALPVWHESQDEIVETPHSSTTQIALSSTAVTATAHADGVIVISMQERQAKNMFSDALISGLKEAFAHIERTPAYKVVVLTGYDNYFAAGGTKETLLAIQEGRAQFTDEKAFQLPMDCPLPVIAAMQGHAIGGGWSFGMFADVILLSDESRYVSPYMGYGFTPGAGSTLVFPEKIGHDLARETLLTAREVSGQELKERGLQLAVLPRQDVVASAIELAKRIARHPRELLKNWKLQWTHALRRSREEIYQREVEMHEQTFVGKTDTLEHIQAKFSKESVSAELSSLTKISVSSEGVELSAVVDELRGMLAQELHLKADDIDESAQFTDLGLDSVTGVTWMRKINARYGTNIEATKIYNHSTLAELGRCVRTEAERTGTLVKVTQAAAILQSTSPPQDAVARESTNTRSKLVSWRGRDRARRREPAGTKEAISLEPIAVIGMAGQFPQARNVEEFWQNIAQGKDCITEVPAKRWDIDAYYRPGEAVAGKTNSRWMGALEEYDLFDPLFFNISPTEARSMDPQQRLFLQTCWHAVEDAGYNPKALSGSRCGVFVGCAHGDYHQLSEEQRLSAQGFTGAASSILAARISYFLNLQGPCIAVDTACSSSLVAISHACDSLITGTSDVALAGGVYVMAGPDMHIKTAQAGMLSSEGRCFAFDQRANGFVPGEAVGVVMLKRLADAQRDQDIIHGVIEGWGVNQDGKTNGITAPSSQSQTRLQQSVYDRYQINPANIQLLEAHGTGTKLGDPIEVEGLKNAFKKYTQKHEYCALGSVKSNIGHCLTAAGVAGVIKVLLALKHKQLPPSINFDQLNEHIEIQDTPFYVNRRLRSWEVKGTERRQAATSSFGFSGTNAHVVIGEYLAPAHAAVVTQHSNIIVPLSARTAEQLQEKACDLLRFIQKSPSIDLVSMAYTLQTGREAMDERLGFLVSSIDELKGKLQAYIAGKEEIERGYQGQVKRNKEGISIISQDDDLKEIIVEQWITQQKLSKLLDLWVKGLALDWNKLYGGSKPRRISLPTYPFAKERYWIDALASATVAADRATSIFQAGELTQDSEVRDLEDQNIGAMLAVPVWEEKESAGKHMNEKYSERHILVCGFPRVTVEEVQGLIEESHCEQLVVAGEKTVAAYYSKYAVWCFKRIQKILCGKRSGKALLQVVVEQGDIGPLSGLSGLLKTATLENPRLLCQLIQTDEQLTSPELVEFLAANTSNVQETVIRYQKGLRQVQGWRMQTFNAESKLGLKEGGVYLITGGLGGLGMLFAQEIMNQASQARVILTGRSALNEEKRLQLQKLGAREGQIAYRVMDLADAAKVREVIEGIKAEYGGLNGILHSAGMIADNFIIKKSSEQFKEVLEPKVSGTVNLDEGSREIALDFMVLFSSVAGALGNVGQADYAAANGFMDWYAGYRNHLVLSGLRSGRTVSINWPLWAKGGMKIDVTSDAQLQETTGMRAMQTSTGMRAFYESLQLADNQLLVMEGIVSKLRNSLVQAITSDPLVEPSEIDFRVLQERTLQKLKQLVGEVINLSPAKIDACEALSTYGLDSMIITKLNQELARTFGEISKTLFFEYSTLESLTNYFISEYPNACLSWTGVQRQQRTTTQNFGRPNAPLPGQSSLLKGNINQKESGRTQMANDCREPIAIIGISGLYPQAATLEQYWDNLKTGKNCISEIPVKRWKLDGFYHADEIRAVEQRKSYCKWGGFVDQFDQFDSLFFGISPREAMNIDPQERLFLQASWHALENSGYTRFDLQNKFKRRVGVFAGVTKTGFNLYGERSSHAEDDFHPHTSFGSVANRVSYFLDITGPSMPIDTMCSSALTAIHEACEHIHRGDCDLALAGGVNLYLHPSTYIHMSTLYALSKDGVCRSFGAGANGFVPGEGVGVVLLKPLSAAVDDNDVIHGVILATHVNHGGKTNGYTVPSPRAQAELIRSAIDKAGISARDISYIEAHGTGTELGDPIEIEGLRQAFEKDTRDVGYCKIGSAKSNIGHLEAAAGMAGLTKVLLQMKHGVIAPSLHADHANPNVAFDKSPFILNTTLTPWECKGVDGNRLARTAGISSFGAGGANAHIIVKEHCAPVEKNRSFATEQGEKVIIPLSARTSDQLQQRARDLLSFIQAEELGEQSEQESSAWLKASKLVSIAYTLQVGREAMEERLGFIVDSIEQLEEKLGAYVNGERAIEGACQGHVKDVKENMMVLGDDDDMREVVDKWISNKKLSKLLECWVRGLKIDWNRLYGDIKPKRVSLPAYPFASERYWIRTTPTLSAESEAHPQVAKNLASIEDLIHRIDDESMEIPHAAELLSALM